MNKLTHDERVKLYSRLLFIISSLIAVRPVPRIFSILAPFIVAFIAAYLLNPLVTVLHKKLLAPRKLWGILVAGLSSLIIWFVYTLVG